MIDGRAVLVAGTTGSGKTVWTMQQTSGARRLLVWDSLGEWTRRGRVAAAPTLAVLGAEVSRYVREPQRVWALGYTGPASRAHFAIFCRLAWVWLRVRSGTLVIEELADVTSPGKAPDSWGEICRKGRHYAAQLYAITQRPAESDKTIVGNAASIHTGLMAFPRDRAYMAQCLDVPVAEIAMLKPLEWIERDMRTRALRRGTLHP
ncbi:MAG: hypothetical protein ACRD1F_01780 [Terriglobales bacterium]